MNKNLLITGTDGFIGNNLKKYFHDQGYNVTGTVYNLREPGDNEVVVNFCNSHDFKNIPNTKFDIIINIAGTVDQGISGKLMMNINSEGTGRMTEWAIKHDCKHFIQISSIAVYGLKLLGEDISEKINRTKIPFAFPYGYSKAKAEEYIEKSGLPGYTLLRLAPVMGANDSFFSHAIISKLLKNDFHFYRKREKKISILYIKNLGPIISKIIESGPQNDAFNCSDFEMTWRNFVYEYAEKLKINKQISVRNPISSLFKLNDKEHMMMVLFSFFGAHYSSNKLLNKIEFSPEYHWKDGILEAVEAYLKK